MTLSYGNNGNDVDFVNQARQRAEAKAIEYRQLDHEEKRIVMLKERVKKYIEQLNSFIESEGQTPVRLMTSPIGSIVGRPGNRTKDFPLRKMEWEGMTLDEIIQSILTTSPDEIFHANILCHKIYEIKSDAELHKVKRSLVSNLRRGVKRGMWEAIPRNRYKAKVTEQQGAFVNA